MTLDFDRMPSLVQPRFKGGQGEAETRIFQDDMGKILRLTLQPGSSIGLHTHEDSCEIMYFLSGTGVCLDDGADTADFRRLLEELRLAARDMTADRLLWKLYTECHALAVFGAMEGGAARKENLIALYTYAGQQAAAGRGGLFDFVTQLHDLLEEGRQPPITTRTAGSGVQIMSVHRSKGLEFPVVILTDLHKTFNADDFRRPVLVHPRLGLGTERVDREKRIRYDTVTKTAVAAALTRESKSEEMRILYVAMTRAKEKLICVQCMAHGRKRLADLSVLADMPTPPEAVAGAKCPGDWLLLPLLCAPEGEPLRRWAEAPPNVSIPIDNGVTSSNTTPLISSVKTAPLTAAPTATTSSGLTPL